MEWIKVTPETMPPAMKPVMATARSRVGKRIVLLKDIRWSSFNGWYWDTKEERCNNRRDTIYPLVDTFEVTHWMPYPEPADIN